MKFKHIIKFFQARILKKQKCGLKWTQNPVILHIQFNELIRDLREFRTYGLALGDNGKIQMNDTLYKRILSILDKLQIAVNDLEHNRIEQLKNEREYGSNKSF